MGRGFTQERTFEVILRERRVSEKDIGWVLSKLDTQQYVLDECHYMAQIYNDVSEINAKEMFVNRYFTLNIKGVTSDNKINELFDECIDKKKIWTLLEKSYGAICIKLPDASVNGERFLFVCGPNKKCPILTNTDSLIFCSENEVKEEKIQNPLEMSSLRIRR